jgi:tetratricopeptide (TPR) repeat protein
MLRAFILIFVVSFIMACGARAPKAGVLEVWSAHWQSANAYYSAADYSNAEAEVKTALSLLKGGSGHSQKLRAKGYHLLGLIQIANAEFEPARKSLEKARSIAVSGSDVLMEAQSLNAIGQLWSLSGHHDTALSTYQRAGELYRSLEGSAEALAQVKINIGLLYLRRADFRYAELQFQQALSLLETLPEPNQLYVSHVLAGLSSVYDQTQRAESAILLKLKRLDVLKSIYGANHVTVAQAMDGVSQSMMSLRQYAQAEQYFLQALSIRESLLGSTHYEVAVTLHNLGLNYLHQQKYVAAEPSLLKARHIFFQATGKESDEFQSATQSLRRLYHAMGQNNKADALSQ